METCRLRACEALVECLANNGNRNITLPERSELQEAMSVPAHLVYIYGLVVTVAEESPPVYTPAQESLFTSLQKLYSLQVIEQQLKEEKSNDSHDDDDDVPPPPTSPPKSRAFQLSPSLKPTDADLQRIHEEVETMMADLETQAQVAEDELRVLAEAETNKTSNKSSDRHQHPKKTPTKITTMAKHIREESMTPRTCETLEQVLAQIQPQSSEEDNNNNNHGWVTVTKKPTKPILHLSRSSSTPTKSKARVSFVAGDCFVEMENQRPVVPPAKAAPAPETMVKTKTDQGAETVVNIKPEDDEASFVEEPKVEVTLVEEKKEEEEDQQPIEPIVEVDEEEHNEKQRIDVNEDDKEEQQREGEEEARQQTDDVEDEEIQKVEGAEEAKQQSEIDDQEEQQQRDSVEVEHTTPKQLEMEVEMETEPVQPPVVKQSVSELSGVAEEVLDSKDESDNNKILNLLEQLQDRVGQLEEALAMSERHFQTQKEEHARELFKEREQAEERQQALQLRLYISETKLKTYEDALAEHVKAVASNTATGPVSSSPDRAPGTLHPVEESPGKRPWESSKE
ncbi:expressed unknown protein [Seminavis robusta]|uniref:Uncharacterized protein n=1 Tax=Seminavis robusta TaxID=568900 RepID=A0A9N8HZF1_9STRA|nr:expressed unknown protein [Seminavis robusta]|eukprot:Sro2888_g339460.1 n/a (567) ;mRNA; r:1753-3453